MRSLEEEKIYYLREKGKADAKGYNAAAKMLVYGVGAVAGLIFGAPLVAGIGGVLATINTVKAVVNASRIANASLELNRISKYSPVTNGDMRQYHYEKEETSKKLAKRDLAVGALSALAFAVPSLGVSLAIPGLTLSSAVGVKGLVLASSFFGGITNNDSRIESKEALNNSRISSLNLRDDYFNEFNSTYKLNYLDILEHETEKLRKETAEIIAASKKRTDEIHDRVEKMITQNSKPQLGSGVKSTEPTYNTTSVAEVATSDDNYDSDSDTIIDITNNYRPYQSRVLVKSMQRDVPSTLTINSKVA